jgi:hypothetical protein
MVTRLLRVPVVVDMTRWRRGKLVSLSRAEGWSCWKAMLMPQPPWLALVDEPRDGGLGVGSSSVSTAISASERWP